MSNDSKSCVASEKLQYDKCNVYDVDYIQIQQKYGSDVEKTKGTITMHILSITS